jgi:hypothetical protein
MVLRFLLKLMKQRRLEMPLDVRLRLFLAIKMIFLLTKIKAKVEISLPVTG